MQEIHESTKKARTSVKGLLALLDKHDEAMPISFIGRIYTSWRVFGTSQICSDVQTFRRGVVRLTEGGTEFETPPRLVSETLSLPVTVPRDLPLRHEPPFRSAEAVKPSHRSDQIHRPGNRITCRIPRTRLCRCEARTGSLKCAPSQALLENHFNRPPREDLRADRGRRGRGRSRPSLWHTVHQFR